MSNAPVASNQLPSLIPCAACGMQLSVDAVTCPSCGHTNKWLHPTLTAIVDHLDALDSDTEVVANGNTMTLKALTTNTRQSIAWLLLFGSGVMLVIGLFSPVFMTLGVMFMMVGGLLIGFGLDAAVQHEIRIDMRTEGKIVGKTDTAFWADVIAMVREEKSI